MKEKSNRQ